MIMMYNIIVLANKRKDYKPKPKTSKRFERVFKGVANYHRIDALLLIEKNPGITLEGIVESMQCNYQTTAEHINRLRNAGLITKKYQGKAVIHSLSPYGSRMTKVIKTLLD